jgi:hypothetical protein
MDATTPPSAIEIAHACDDDKEAARGRIVHLCAARADDAVVDALLKHLAGVPVTHERTIPIGTSFKIESRVLLDTADVILLLVSADFMASPDCMADAERALQRDSEKAARVLCVLGRACTWEYLPFAHLFFLPRDQQPIVAGQALREEALRDVAQEVRALLDEPAETDTACPFPGLEVFNEERAADFFGREAEVSDALSELTKSHPPRHWLHIDGPSGAGKSSFARAGIVPAVRAGAITGPEGWVVAVLRPGQNPIWKLAEALFDAKPPLKAHGRSLDALANELWQSDTALKGFLREARPEGYSVLLLVDQLEEAFTLASPDRAAVVQFDKLLAAALDDTDGPLLLLTTVRVDFVARMCE